LQPPVQGTKAEDVHVLVVDDDPRIRSMLTDYLQEQGLRVSVAEDGREMWTCIDRSPVDVVLLDVVLPGEDGLTLARQLRARVETPIIMLTGRGDVVDRVVGLEMGADDYVAKPFHLREVLARIRSVLRRARVATPTAETAASDAPESGFTFDGWQVNLQRRQVYDPAGLEIVLTSGEYELLLAFVENPNRVLTRDRLMDLAKGRRWEAYDRSVDAQVARLRRKIEPDPKAPVLIKSVRGAGYIFVPNVARR
jgi:two-component system, OmpR family, response regulator